SLRPYQVTNPFAVKDSNNDWYCQVSSNARPSEEPANFVFEIWSSTDRSNPANQKRIMPGFEGIPMAAILSKTSGPLALFAPPEPEVHQNIIEGPRQSGYSGSGATVHAKSVQQVNATNAFVEAQMGEGIPGGTGPWGGGTNYGQFIIALAFRHVANNALIY